MLHLSTHCYLCSRLDVFVKQIFYKHDLNKQDCHVVLLKSCILHCSNYFFHIIFISINCLYCTYCIQMIMIIIIVKYTCVWSKCTHFYLFFVQSPLTQSVRWKPSSTSHAQQSQTTLNTPVINKKDTTQPRNSSSSHTLSQHHDDEHGITVHEASSDTPVISLSQGEPQVSSGISLQTVTSILMITIVIYSILRFNSY